MQAFEQQRESLRRAIRQWLGRIGWRSAQTTAGARLAQDLGMPTDLVSVILDRTAADLRKLSSSDDDNFDARPIIDRAVHELGQLGFESRPFEEAAMERYLQELPDTDYQILRHFKQGKKHSEIAALVGTDVGSVRDSLINTYADLRVRMTSSSNGDGGGITAPAPASSPRSGSLDGPLKRTSLRHN